jgi:hypothetical protein
MSIEDEPLGFLDEEDGSQFGEQDRESPIQDTEEEETKLVQGGCSSGSGNSGLGGLVLVMLLLAYGRGDRKRTSEKSRLLV